MFINKETEKIYNTRLNRYTTAMRGGTPDRIPIRFYTKKLPQGTAA